MEAINFENETISLFNEFLKRPCEDFKGRANIFHAICSMIRDGGTRLSIYHKDKIIATYDFYKLKMNEEVIDYLYNHNLLSYIKEMELYFYKKRINN